MRAIFNLARGSALADVQEEIRHTVDSLGIDVRTKLLTGKTVNAAETPIPHGLGVVPNGWQAYSPQADARIWQTKAPDATYLYLRASAIVVTGLRVF